VNFEWDPEKARRNIAKHGVSFTLAEEVWDDPLHLLVPERVIDGEQRWLAIGSVGEVALLVVVHTYRAREGYEIVRIISARRATKYERRSYEDDA